MSYLHCPACSRAYNLATHPACPRCTAAASIAPAPTVVPVAPTVASGDDIASALAALTRALAVATPLERAAAAACVERLATPAAAAAPDGAVWRGSHALAPLPARPASKRARLASMAFAVLDRLAPRAPSRLARVVERVRAFAA